jgi:ferredoxin-NADP reductase
VTHAPELKSITPVTRDTYHLVLERPEGYAFTPGQATDVALDRDGWREEARPFTFTSLPDAPTLEFVVKSYPADHPDHSGMTARIATLEPGERLLLGDPWGAIQDRGTEPHPGVFIAGGAGVTPFIGILLARQSRLGTAGGATLLFSNATEADIILRETWEGMSGLDARFTVTEADAPGLRRGMIDGAFLDAELATFDDVFYVCGPPPMEEAVTDALKARGVPDERIVTEA